MDIHRNLLQDDNPLQFHHTGIAVESISESVVYYAAIFGSENISEPVFVSSQKVNVCFIKNGDNCYIELVEPTDEASPLHKLLKKRISYYHVGYKVGNIHKMIEKLERLHFKALPVFSSEAFDGKLCVFLYTPEAYLIELIEA